eukprot:10836107-Karenia_brevis.AAC.1
MEVHSRTTEEKVHSPLSSLTPPQGPRNRSRARSSGGIPQPRYSMDDVLKGIEMNEEGRRKCVEPGGYVWIKEDMCGARRRMGVCG